MNKEVFENAYIKLWFKNGILYGVYAKNLQITLEIAQICVQSRINFSKGISQKCLVHAGGVRGITKEARAYLANEGGALVEAGAIIINNPFTKMMGNIFLAVDKPKIPSKLFTKEAEAVKWLQNFKE